MAQIIHVTTDSLAPSSARWDYTYTNVEQNSSLWFTASADAIDYTTQNFLALSGGVVTSLTVVSSLFVIGSAFFTQTEDLVITGPIVYVATDNQQDNIDLGLLGGWNTTPGNPAGTRYGGLLRRADNKVWTLFNGVTATPLTGQNIDWNQALIQLDSLSAKYYGDHFTDTTIFGQLNVTNGLTVTGIISGNNLQTSFNQGSATGDYSFAEGSGIATGNYSHAEGTNTRAQNTGSHAEGSNTLASGNNSHVEGSNTIASGNNSHAEGAGSQATGNNSHTEGSNTIASGGNSHAEGSSTIASGGNSHAEGLVTRARGNTSHAAGSYTEAAHDRAWIWKGSTETDYLSTTRADQFMVSAAGGIAFYNNVGISTDSTQNALTVNGLISASNDGNSAQWNESYKFSQSTEAYRRNLFSRVLTNDTVLYKGPQVLNNWLQDTNGLYYHPLYYRNLQTNQLEPISANFGLSYNFTGQFTYMLSATNTITNNNFDFDLISNIQYVDSGATFLIGEGFGYNSGSNINAILSCENQFLIGGSINYFNDGRAGNFAAINNNGRRNYTFGNSISGFNGFVTDLKLDTNNKIVVVGNFNNYDGSTSTRLARLNPNGTFDNTLSGINFGFNGPVNVVQPLPNEKIVVVGNFTSYNTGIANQHLGLIRLNYDGTIDTSLSAVPGTNRFTMPFGQAPNIRSMLNDPDGKMLIGGYFSAYNGVTNNNFIRLNYDGSIDTSLSAGGVRFTSPVQDEVYTITRGLNDTYMLGGSFGNYGGQNVSRFVRINYDGSLDVSLSAVGGAQRFNGQVLRVVMQPDNKILVGGLFSSYNSVTARSLIRLNYDGSIDNTFTTGAGFNGAVTNIIVLSNGKILVSGSFTAYNNQPVRGLALLNSNGSLDTSSQERFVHREYYKLSYAGPGTSIMQTTLPFTFSTTFLPFVKDNIICIASLQPIAFATVDYTLISNYGSGTVGFGSS